MPTPIMKLVTSTARAVERSQLDRKRFDLIGTLSVWPATWKLRLGSDLSTAVTWVSASFPSGLRSVLPGSNRILSPRRTIIRFSRISTCSLPASVSALNCVTSLRNCAARASACACAFFSSSIRFFASASSPPRLPRSVSSRETSCPSDDSLLESTKIRASRASISFLRCAFSASSAVCVAASFCFSVERSRGGREVPGQVAQQPQAGLVPSVSEPSQERGALLDLGAVHRRPSRRLDGRAVRVPSRLHPVERLRGRFRHGRYFNLIRSFRLVSPTPTNVPARRGGRRRRPALRPPALARR